MCDFVTVATIGVGGFHKCDETRNKNQYDIAKKQIGYGEQLVSLQDDQT